LFSDGKFVSANHILQNFLSAEKFPEWKCALTVFSSPERAMAHCDSNEVLIVGGVGCK
jgi:tRNA A37 threonylcarbamoyltransferase TsaD